MFNVWLLKASQWHCRAYLATLLGNENILRASDAWLGRRPQRQNPKDDRKDHYAGRRQMPLAARNLVAAVRSAQMQKKWPVTCRVLQANCGDSQSCAYSAAHGLHAIILQHHSKLSKGIKDYIAMQRHNLLLKQGGEIVTSLSHRGFQQVLPMTLITIPNTLSVPLCMRSIVVGTIIRGIGKI